MSATKNKTSSAAVAPVRRHLFGVYGLTEWHAVIRAGKASIRIPFTGGMLSGYGCTPATFETTSEALAKIIERSDYYQSKKIVKLS